MPSSFRACRVSGLGKSPSVTPFCLLTICLPQLTHTESSFS